MICESRMNRTKMKPSAALSYTAKARLLWFHVFTQDNESTEVRFVLKLLETELTVSAAACK